jgi:predicted permease
VAFSVFAPCLIFTIVVESRVAPEALLRMFGFVFAVLLLLAGLAFGIARARGWTRTRTSALMLTVMLPNAGNLGLSTSMLAFGDEALAQASLFFLASSMLAYTLGVFVSSLGRASLREAALGLFRVPAIWALAVAFVALGTGWSLPAPVATSVDMLAAACIPTFLVILGMQLRGAALKGPAGPIALATGLRLSVAPALALVLAPLFGLEGAAQQAGVLQAAMPSAVIAIILATEYDVEPAFVTSVVFVTTVLSPLTLTPLMALLGGR